jgi:hypothetical protein
VTCILSGWAFWTTSGAGMIAGYACLIRDAELGTGSTRMRSKSTARSAPFKYARCPHRAGASTRTPAHVFLVSPFASLQPAHARSRILRSATFLGICDSTAVYLGIAPVVFIILATLGWCAFCHTLRAPRSADVDETPSRDGLDLHKEDALLHTSKPPYDTKLEDMA